MRALRILVAGLVGLAAMLAVMFAATVVFLTGLAAYILQLFGSKTRPAGGPPPPNRTPPPRRTDEVIDVVATKVPADPAGH
jgi:hypothetical protein